MTAFDLALPRKVLFGPGRADELAAILPTLGSRVLLCTGSDPARHRHLLGDVEPVAVVRVTREPLVDDARSALDEARAAGADSGRRDRRGQRPRPGQGGRGAARQRHGPSTTSRSSAGACRSSGRRCPTSRSPRRPAPVPRPRRTRCSAAPSTAARRASAAAHAGGRRARRSAADAAVPARRDGEQRARRADAVPGALRLAQGQPGHRRRRGRRAAARCPVAPPCLRARRRPGRPRGHGAVQPLRRHRPGQRQAGCGARRRGRRRRDDRRPARGGVRRAAGPGGRGERPRAARARSRLARPRPLRRRARLLTGRDAATVEDAVAWLRETVAALDVPPLGRWGCRRRQYAEVAEKAARSSSMQGNPMALSADELVAVLDAAGRPSPATRLRRAGGTGPDPAITVWCPTVTGVHRRCRAARPMGGPALVGGRDRIARRGRRLGGAGRGDRTGGRASVTRRAGRPRLRRLHRGGRHAARRRRGPVAVVVARRHGARPAGRLGEQRHRADERRVEHQGLDRGRLPAGGARRGPDRDEQRAGRHRGRRAPQRQRGRERLYHALGGDAMLRDLRAVCGVAVTTSAARYWSLTQISAVDATRIFACVLRTAPGLPGGADL